MKLEDLQPFCSVDETRFGICGPFRDGSHTYATDGRIIIRVDAIDGIDRRDGQPNNPGSAIPAGTGYKPLELPPGWESFRAAKSQCEDCEGTGHQVKCHHCNGEGETECETCGHEEECRPCGGTGRAPKRKEGPPSEPCDNCDGLGEYELPFAVCCNRGEVTLDLRYLRLAHSLPNVRLQFLDAKSPVRVDFDGGDGAIMPTRKHENEGQPITDQWAASAGLNS